MKSLSLYEIDKEIDDVLSRIINEETGELDTIAELELEQLKADKIQKIANIGLFIKNLNAFAESAKEEEKKIRERRQSVEKKVEWLKNYIKSSLNGEKVDLPNLRISYRKSESIEVSIFADLDKIHRKYPNLVGIEYKPNKKEIKEFIKTSGVSFEGISIQEKESIIIK